MIHSVISRQQKPSPQLSQKALSSTSSTPTKNILAADAGPLATHIYHKLTSILAFTTPIYLFAPTESLPFLEKSFSLALATTLSVHSWIGLNYVAADYVPKVSKALLGPSRVIVAGFSVITFLGLGQVSLFTDGGIKGLMKGLWKKADKVEEERKA